MDEALNTLLRSFCCCYCPALDCADGAEKDELPAMSPELAAMRDEIEEFYQNFVDIQGGNGKYYTLAVAEPEGEEYDRLTLSPESVAELVAIHESMLLRESREMFRDLRLIQGAVEIGIFDEPDVPF